MPANPFRRRRRVASVAGLAAIDAAAALARNRLDPRSRRGDRTKLLALGGAAAVAVGIAGFAGRKKVAGLIGAGASVPEPPPPPAPPQPANVDVAGPPANTATPLAAPEPAIPSGDEEAEVQAAAAEAAAIGGEVSEYASTDPTLPADEEDQPVVEAGGGEAEGQEQTEAQLEENLQPPEGQGEIAAQERLEEAIAAAGQPAAGETVEPRTPIDEPSLEEDERKENDGPGWQTWSGVSSEP
jgi:hypothetical protein